MSRSLRLLDLLVQLYPLSGRQWLYARILHGDVSVNGHREYDPKRLVRSDSMIQLQGGAPPAEKDDSDAGLPPPYVSRGGFKLESVLERARAAGFDYAGKVVLDAGASTGGFSHCLLLAGAAEVHAVDVGYNQLDYRLRGNPRVHVHERCNIMSLEPGQLSPVPALAVADLSFRSMEGVAGKILSLLEPAPGGEALLLALIKPQFELEYSDIQVPGFKGVLQDEKLISQILESTSQRLAQGGVLMRELWPSSLKGGRGNQEYFALLSSTPRPVGQSPQG